MQQILVALSLWLHAIGTLILIGHYFLLSVIYLPVLERGAEFFSDRSRSAADHGCMPPC